MHVHDALVIRYNSTVILCNHILYFINEKDAQ